MQSRPPRPFQRPQAVQQESLRPDHAAGLSDCKNMKRLEVF